MPQNTTFTNCNRCFFSWSVFCGIAADSLLWTASSHSSSSSHCLLNAAQLVDASSTVRSATVILSMNFSQHSRRCLSCWRTVSRYCDVVLAFNALLQSDAAVTLAWPSSVSASSSYTHQHSITTTAHSEKKTTIVSLVSSHSAIFTIKICLKLWQILHSTYSSKFYN